MATCETHSWSAGASTAGTRLWSAASEPCGCWNRCRGSSCRRWQNRSKRMARIIVGSYLVQFPLGGYVSWVGQWLIGLHRLGHEVWFVEKCEGPNACYDPLRNEMTDDCGYGTGIVRDFLC